MPKRLRTTTFGTFSKALDNGLSLNFDVSAGASCDRRCPHHPESTAAQPDHACYAVRTEQRPDRSQLANKLQRHARLGAAQVCGAALVELNRLLERGLSIPWLRLSTNGSLPRPAVARRDRLFVSQLRALLTTAVRAGIPVHLPVETKDKARFYHALIGDLVVVRESAVSARRFLRADGAVSVSAGRPDQTRRQRVEEARQLARKRRERTGRKVVVCPAVLNSFAARRDPALKNSRAKCGACVVCSRPDSDCVYPLH